MKTVNVVAEMCFCKHSQVCRNALRFFMGDALPVMMEENLNQKLHLICMSPYHLDGTLLNH